MRRELRASAQLLMALRARGVGSLFLRQLTARIAVVHRVTGRARDSRTWLARGKTFRARHALIFICRQARRAVRPKTCRKTEVADCGNPAPPAGKMSADSLPDRRGRRRSGSCGCVLRDRASAGRGNAHRPWRIDRSRAWQDSSPPGIGAVLSLKYQRYRVIGESACLRMLARRAVASATRDPQLRNLGIPRFRRPVETRLRFDVVAENAVRIPLRNRLGIGRSVRMKK